MLRKDNLKKLLTFIISDFDFYHEIFSFLLAIYLVVELVKGMTHEQPTFLQKDTTPLLIITSISGIVCLISGIFTKKSKQKPQPWLLLLSSIPYILVTTALIHYKLQTTLYLNIVLATAVFIGLLLVITLLSLEGKK